MRSLSVDERKLLIIQGFDILAYALASIFVTVFFFANSDIATTAFYRAITFLSMTFFLAISGWTLRKISSGLQMKISLVAGGLYYLLLFLLGPRSVHFIVPLGILDGLSGGLYWAAFNLNQYILTHAGRRVAYFGWGLAIVNLAQALGPTIGGFVIAFIGETELGVMAGYVSLFLLVSVIMFAVAFVIGKLPSHEMPQFRYSHLLHHQRSHSWKLVLWQQATLGFYDMVLSTVTGILLYLIIRKEAQLGLTLTVASTLAMVSSIIVTRVLTKYPLSYWVGALGSTVAIATFGISQTVTGMWAFIVISGLTTPFLLTKLSTTFFEELDRTPGTWQHKYHLMLERDIVLGLLRTTSYALFFLFLQFGDQVRLAQTSLLILPAAPLFLGFLIAWYHRMPKAPAWESSNSA